MASDRAVYPGIPMSEPAPLLAADPVQALDAAVCEVFERMLGVDCVVLPSSHQAQLPEFLSGMELHLQPRWQVEAQPAGAIPVPVNSPSAIAANAIPANVIPVSAILGLAGKLSGSCILRAAPAAVTAMARHLLALPLPHWHEATTLDHTTLDAFGEICNMIAGGWKNRIPGLDAGCALSVPTIVSGSDYVLHTVGDRLLVDQLYRFGEFRMQVAIHCDTHTLGLAFSS